MSSVTPTIELDQVCKHYERVSAVEDLSLAISPGQVFGLLGPNGAGKTSTIRMMLGIIPPDSGAARMFGSRLTRRSLRRSGYLPEERGLYGKMTVRDNLVFFARLSGLDAATARHKSEAWSERLGLGDRLDQRLDQLSKGMQQKVQFIAAVAHDPELIVMDEPFTALDPVNVNQLRHVLMELRTQGRAIAFSSHRMDQVEQLCDSICLINRGRCVLQGSLREIKSAHGEHLVEIEYDGEGKFLDANPLVERCQRRGGHVEVRLRPGADPQELLRLAAADSRIRRFEIRQASIEQIFIDLIGGRDGNC